jgi:hypothetical protein
MKVESASDGIRALLDDAAPRPWFHVGPPWASSPGLVYAGAEDPHAGLLIADVGGDAFEEPWAIQAIEATAELVVRAVNEYESLIELEGAIRRQLGFTGMGISQEAAEALGRLDAVRRPS